MPAPLVPTIPAPAAMARMLSGREARFATRLPGSRKMTKAMLLGLTVVGMGVFGLGSSKSRAGEADKVASVLNVAPVWSTHLVGSPVLLTSGQYQYVLYYDKDRHVALAQRKLASEKWDYYTFPEVLGWATDAHCNLSMAVDVKGHLHVSAYNRGFAMAPSGPIYYRTEKPHDISVWIKPAVTSVPVPCYPTFVRTADNKLMYKFRQGSAIKGDNLWSVYDQDAGQWQPCRVLTAGIAFNRYAYNNMVLGPDGYIHCAYIWADASTPDNFNTVSYIRSKDLENWETIAGDKVTTPLTYETQGVVVCPVPHNSGMLNNPNIGFDSAMRPIITYQLFDENGNTQFYNARYENGSWNNVAATKWDYRWRWVASDDGGIIVGPARPLCEGRLLQEFNHIKYGQGFIVLDEKTLNPVGSTHQYTLVPSSALKLARKATASSEVPGFEAAKAVDGDPKSRWQPKPEDKEPFLELDFGRELVFEHFSLLQLRLNILAFSLDYWEGGTWQGAYRSTEMQTTFHNIDKIYAIRPVTARKVRLRITSILQTPTPHEKPGELPAASVFKFDVYVKETNPHYPKDLKERITPWPLELVKQESTFPLRPMAVDWFGDSGGTTEEGMKYYLRWEHGPANRDAEVPQPWPDPTMLRVYKLRTVQPEAYAQDLLKAIK